MVNIAFAVIMFIIVAIGFTYIFMINKINKLDTQARDKGVEIDSALWDRSFRLSEIVKILDAKKISHEIEAPEISAFSLGMSPTVQSLNAEKLDKMNVQLNTIIKDNPGLKDEETFATNLAKFNLARQEMFKYSLAYNKAAAQYNNCISDFPGSVIASIHKKKHKEIFNYVFAELKES